MQIQAGLDEIAAEEIKELKAYGAKLERRLAKVTQEVYELRSTKVEVQRALEAIRSFAFELPAYEWE